MMCVALAQAGFAAFLHFRTRNFPLAIFASQTLVAAAGNHPPHGRGRIRGSSVPDPLLRLEAHPLFPRRPRRDPIYSRAAGWGLYIMRDPALFFSQLAVTGPTASPSHCRSKPPAADHPALSEYHGFAPDTQGFSHAKVVVLIATSRDSSGLSQQGYPES